MSDAPTGSTSPSAVMSTVVLVSTRPMFLRSFGKLLATLRPSFALHAISSADEPMPDGVPALVVLDAGGVAGAAVGALVGQWLARDGAGRVVPVLDETDDASVEAAMAAGASGVLVKAAPPGVLAEWLDAVLDGAVVRPAPSVALEPEALPEELRGRLSARRQKLLRLVMGGHSVSAVARELGMTPAKVVLETRVVMDIVRGRDGRA